MCTPFVRRLARRAARFIRVCTICRVNGVAVVLTEHARAPQVPMLDERRGQPSRQRHVPQPPTLRRSDLPVPVRPRTQSCRFARSTSPHSSAIISPHRKPGLTAQQHDEMRARIDRPRDLDEPFVLVEVVERRRALSTGSSLTVHGIRSMTSHSTAFFSSTLSTASTLFTVFGDFDLQLRFQPLHVLALDRVELSCDPTPASGARRRIMLLRRDAARLLPIRPRVAVHESRRERL